MAAKARLRLGTRRPHDFVPLRETPFIEARPDELVLPAMPLLFAKMDDGPFYALSEHLDDPRVFQTALGKAYEAYAHELVNRLANANSWRVEPSPTVDGDELTDSYLQRGTIGVLFEHKGQRPSADYLRGGPGERVLGPRRALIAALDAGHAVSLLDGKRADDGLLTKGTWQQSLNGSRLAEWAEEHWGSRPTTLHPVITYLAPLRADTLVQQCYLRPLQERAGLYDDALFSTPVWLHITELEAIVALVEHGCTTLEDLLNDYTANSPSTEFEEYLRIRFGGFAMDQALVNAAYKFLRNTARAMGIRA